MKKILFVAALGLVFAACSGKSDAASSESATQVAEETVSTAGAPEAAMEVKIDTVGYTTTASGLKYKEIKAGKVEYRLDKTNIIHVAIGKKSFGAEKLVDNYNTIFDAIVKAKPAAAKGQYIKSATISSTMGPGLKIAVKM